MFVSAKEDTTRAFGAAVTVTRKDAEIVVPSASVAFTVIVEDPPVVAYAGVTDTEPSVDEDMVTVIALLGMTEVSLEDVVNAHWDWLVESSARTKGIVPVVVD